MFVPRIGSPLVYSRTLRDPGGLTYTRCRYRTFFTQSDEVSGEVDKLKSTLADDSTGQDASDRFSAEISQLKADVAAERVRFSHITEALEATKGSLEEVRLHRSVHDECVNSMIYAQVVLLV